MGTWNRYFCRKCPYEAFVSGGDDVGMAAATSTALSHFDLRIPYSGFTGGKVIMVVDDAKSYQSKKVSSCIYRFFRSGHPLTGRVEKPTGKKTEGKLILCQLRFLALGPKTPLYRR